MLKIPLRSRQSVERTKDFEILIYREPLVALDGEDWTRDTNERVLMSEVKEGIARKASKIPAGGVGPS